MIYTDSFKAKMVQRMSCAERDQRDQALEGGRRFAVSALALAAGGSYGGTDDQGTTVGSAPCRPAATRSAEEKVRIVMAAAALGPERARRVSPSRGRARGRARAVARGDRRRGDVGSRGRRERRPSSRGADSKRIKELERELRRKDKALAETAALLVLQKKVHEIWGDGDDDTDEGNEK